MVVDKRPHKLSIELGLIVKSAGRNQRKLVVRAAIFERVYLSTGPFLRLNLLPLQD